MMPVPQPGLDQSAANLAQLQRLQRLRDQSQHRALTGVEQAELEKEPACVHCGGFHARACPRVKRIAFHAGSGQIAEVEYWPHSEVSWTGVVFEDVGGGEDEFLVPLADIEDIVNALSEPVAGLDAWSPRVKAAALRVAAWLEGAEP